MFRAFQECGTQKREVGRNEERKKGKVILKKRRNPEKS